MSKLNFNGIPDGTGGGRRTLGGKYGVIDIVDNLNNSGAGSFRQAVTDAGRTVNTPSIVIFRTSGNVELDRIPVGTGSNWLFIRKNKTILGASSPEGITLKGLKIGISNSTPDRTVGNVIITHLASRVGDENPPSALNNDPTSTTLSMYVVNMDDIYIGHCSFSWAADEIFSPFFVRDGTAEYCIISEALDNPAFERDSRYANSSGEPHGFGMILGGSNFSCNHNLFAHATQRFPMFNGLHLVGQIADSGDRVGLVDFRWNTIYNWSQRAGNGGAGHDWNVVRNSYIPGPATLGKGRWGTTWTLGSNRGVARNFIRPSKVNSSEAFGKFYLSENNMEGSPSEWDDDNWIGCTDFWGEAVTNDWKSLTEHPLPSGFYPSTSKSRITAHNDVLSKAGMFTFNNALKDPIDERVKNNVINRDFTTPIGTISPTSGLGIIDRVENVGGWRTYPNTTPQVFDGDAPHYIPASIITKYGLNMSQDYMGAGTPAEKPWMYIFFENPATSIGVNYQELPSGYDWENTIHHRVHEVVVFHRTGQIDFLENTVETYSLTVTAGENGTVNTSGGDFEPSTSVFLQAFPASGFRLLRWERLTGDTWTQISTSTSFNFLMPSQNTQVRALFTPISQGNKFFARKKQNI
jgi:hypothetical protein